MPSFSDIFSDDKCATETSSGDPFVPNPGEGEPDNGDKPEGGDGGSTIASGSAPYDDFGE